MRGRMPSAGRFLQLALALAAVLAAAAPFYRGESDNLATAWFFLAIAVGALIGHAWAFALAPIPFLLGATLARWAQGPTPPGYGLYPGYEYSLGAVVMAIMGAVGILAGIVLRRWIRMHAWRRAGPMAGVITILLVAWGNRLYQDAFRPTVRFTLAGDPGQGYMLRLSATDAHGTTAHTHSSPPAMVLVQEGVAQVCEAGPSPAAPPRFTITGQRFKPQEAVRIEGEYMGDDCALMLVAGQARADATGAFTVELEATPDSQPPPEH